MTPRTNQNKPPNPHLWFRICVSNPTEVCHYHKGLNCDITHHRKSLISRSTPMTMATYYFKSMLLFQKGWEDNLPQCVFHPVLIISFLQNQRNLSHYTEKYYEREHINFKRNKTNRKIFTCMCPSTLFPGFSRMHCDTSIYQKIF